VALARECLVEGDGRFEKRSMMKPAWSLHNMMQSTKKNVFTTLLPSIVVSLKNKLKTLKFLSIIMLNLFSGSYTMYETLSHTVIKVHISHTYAQINSNGLAQNVLFFISTMEPM
jgi:hypothetical protein